MSATMIRRAVAALSIFAAGGVATWVLMTKSSLEVMTTTLSVRPRVERSFRIGVHDGAVGARRDSRVPEGSFASWSTTGALANECLAGERATVRTREVVPGQFLVSVSPTLPDGGARVAGFDVVFRLDASWSGWKLVRIGVHHFSDAVPAPPWVTDLSGDVTLDRTGGPFDRRVAMYCNLRGSLLDDRGREPTPVTIEVEFDVKLGELSNAIPAQVFESFAIDESD